MHTRMFGKTTLGIGTISVLSVIGLLSITNQGRAQDRDREDRPDRNDRIERIASGTVIPVRTNEAIDVERRDNRVYHGIVDQDVRAGNGRIAIPRGSTVELIVRVAQDNDLIVDLESVVSNGQRYAIKTDASRIESQRDNSLVGAITGAITGVRGRAVRVPRDSVLTFRIERPLEVGVEDRGTDREGRHYHDYYGDR